MKTNHLVSCVLVLWAAVLGVPESSHAQGTAFTYQGRLMASGAPANGSYDLTLTLFGQLSGGAAVAGPLTSLGTSVSNGIFSVVLDFGANAFNGSARWLEIGVRTNGGGSYIPLSPRQPVLPVPYSIFAGTASNVASGNVVQSVNGLRDNLTLSAGANVSITPSGNTLTIASTGGGSSPWLLNGTNTYYNAGNVGVGTTSPGAKIHAITAASGEGLRLQGRSSGAANLSYLSFVDSVGTRIGYVGDGSTGDNGVFLSSDAGSVILNTAAGRVLTATAAGDLDFGASIADYHHLSIGGGNSYGFIYGSYPRFGDGIHIGYNYYADASGVDRVIHTDGATSRISAGYGSVVLATGGLGQRPVDRLTVDSTGNVLIRNSAGTLDYYATAGEENLRILRGHVEADGTPTRGCCFSVSKCGTGCYDITYTRPFADIPSVTIQPSAGEIDATLAGFGPGSTPTSTAVRVITRYNGSSIDARFDIIAVGAR